MTKKGLKSYKKRLITKTEKEVLHLVSDEFLTIKQIALQRGVSLQAIYKTIKKLKEKGYLNNAMGRVENVESTPSKRDIRLHGQELNINILYQDNKYQELLEKSNIIFIDSNTIRLYKKSIEIYSGQSFYGKTINEVENKSLEYLRRFLTRLEHDLKIILVKPRARNIKIVNQHYARGDSEISEKAMDEKERIWIYAEEDGKLAYLTDNSFGFKEDETIHPITAKKDRKAVDKQVNDWRLNNPPTNSELAHYQAETQQGLKILIEMNKDLPKNMQLLAQQIESHLKLINRYEERNGIENRRTLNLIKKVEKENISWRKKKTKEIKKELKLGHQTKLGDF